MASITIKRGSTISLQCLFSDNNGVAKSLAGITITSSLSSGRDLMPLVTTVLESGVNNVGIFILSLDAISSRLLNICNYSCDIKYSYISGEVVYSDTFRISIEGEVTE